MKKIKINEKEYEVIENYKDALKVENLSEMVTDYFDNYDYETDEARNYCYVNGGNYAELRVVEVE